VQPPSFVDREATAHPRQLFGTRTGGPAVVCALTAGRGVGKTQTAAAFARERIAEGRSTGTFSVRCCRASDGVRLSWLAPTGDAPSWVRSLTYPCSSARNR
jgi:hypothetical protein